RDGAGPAGGPSGRPPGRVRAAAGDGGVGAARVVRLAAGPRGAGAAGGVGSAGGDRRRRRRDRVVRACDQPAIAGERVLVTDHEIVRSGSRWNVEALVRRTVRGRGTGDDVHERTSTAGAYVCGTVCVGSARRTPKEAGAARRVVTDDEISLPVHRPIGRPCPRYDLHIDTAEL